MNTWFTSDTHFWHANVIEFCKRPFSSVEEMNEALIQNWKYLVRPEDHVYVLGDFAMTGPTKIEPIMKRLNGHKFLIRGNHDWHMRYRRWLMMGFEMVTDNTSMIAGNVPLLLSHFPFKQSVDVDDRYVERRISDDGKSILLHGHVHCSYKQKGRMVNVGTDVWSYAPVHLDELLALVK